MAGNAIGNVGTLNFGKAAGLAVNREDMIDAVTLADPYLVPAFNSMPRVTATAIEHVWNEVTMPTISSTASVEGADWALDTTITPTRKYNYAHLITQNIAVSGTQKAVKSAGGPMYDLTKLISMRAVLRNLSYAMFAITAAPSAQTTVSGTRSMAGIEYFVQSGNLMGTSTNGYYTGIVGDATHSGVANAADFNYGIRKGVDASGPGEWTAYCNSSIRQQISAFNLFPFQSSTQATGGMAANSNMAGAVKFMDAAQKILTYAVDRIQTDFGTIDVVFDFTVPQSANTVITLGSGNTDLSGRCFVLKKGYTRFAMLRGLQYQPVGIRGDSEAGLVLVEGCPEVLSTKAHVVFKQWNNVSAYTPSTG